MQSDAPSATEPSESAGEPKGTAASEPAPSEPASATASEAPAAEPLASDAVAEQQPVASGEFRRSEPAPSPLAQNAARAAVWAAALLFLVAVVRYAWIADDAFITIRSVDNLVRGNGLVLNLGERVQSFTSPLGALLCVPFFALTSSPYAALMLPCLLCCLGLALVVARGLRSEPWRAAVVLLAFTASSAFLEFSTSGLENSLAHLLAAAFCIERLGRGPGPTRNAFLLAAGLVLTRLDYACLLAPPLLLAILRDPRASLRLAWPAAAVVSAWFLFATFYFGFPLPNTAYAKLNTTLAAGDKILQGVAYVVDSASRDPIVLVTMGLSAILVLQKGASLAARGVLAGVGLYLAYVVSIGGDYMSGRFFTTCFVVSALVASSLAADLHGNLLPVAAGALLFLGASSFSERRVDGIGSECGISRAGISVERGCYAPDLSLSQNIRRQRWKEHGYVNDTRAMLGRNRERVLDWNFIGMGGYASKRPVHFVERFALSEPLLARITLKPDGGWRPGHFMRPIPEGYMESLRTGENVIKDPCLHALHDKLRLAVHAPLFSGERLAAIWALNTSKSTCPAP